MKNIAAKMSKLMAKCEYVQKDGQNKEQRYNYVSAANILEKVNPALSDLGMCSYPEFTMIAEQQKQTSRNAWNIVTIQCKLTIVDAESGEYIVATSLGQGADPMDKAVAKAQTQALKYAWMTALNISTGDDPESDNRADTELTIDSKFKSIANIWTQVGWKVSDLEGWLIQRFNKPTDQLTTEEITAAYSEIKKYLNEKGV